MVVGGKKLGFRRGCLVAGSMGVLLSSGSGRLLVLLFLGMATKFSSVGLSCVKNLWTGFGFVIVIPIRFLGGGEGRDCVPLFRLWLMGFRP